VISVCLATYNGENYIESQLSSILEQLGEQDEIIISDDNSTDNTREIIERFGDKRINLFLNTRENKGSINNFEHALNKCHGTIIFLCDQDDIWLPGKVVIMKEKLGKNINLVVADSIVVNEKLEILYESFYEVNNSGNGVVKNLIKNSYVGCMMAFKEEILPYILPFPKNIPAHDIWIGTVAGVTGKTAFIQDKLLLYRRHGNNVSSTSELSKFSLFQKIKFRFYTVIYIPEILKRVLINKFYK